MANGHGGKRAGAGRPRSPTGTLRKSDGRRLTTVGKPGPTAKRSYLERDLIGLRPGNPMTAQHIDGNRNHTVKANLKPMTRSANVADENHRGLNGRNKVKAPKKK